jgi:hypothetical protein
MSRYALTLFTTLLLANAGFAAEAPPAAAPSASPAPMPLVILGRPWTLMGNGGPLALPGRCDTGLDSQKFADLPPLHSVRCTSAVLPSWGGAYKTDIDVAFLRGKRVRISASLKGEAIEKVANAQFSNIEGEGGLWIALGTPRDGLSTNRMQERAIRGTTGWEVRDFVVDVPADANQLMAGYWMQGRGQMWVRDLKVEEVPLTVAVNWNRKAPNPSGVPDMSLAVATVPRPTDAFLPPPVKWFATGEQGFELCDVGVDAKMLVSGQPNLSIACKVPVLVFLRQAPVAPPYWGKRVRFSGWIKTENVVARSDVQSAGGSIGSAQGAALFISASDTQGPARNAAVTGTSPWTYRELVIDIAPGTNAPGDAKFLPMGVVLNGTGQVWVRDLKFEEVPRDTPLTP